jgi:hypothetical protein
MHVNTVCTLLAEQCFCNWSIHSTTVLAPLLYTFKQYISVGVSALKAACAALHEWHFFNVVIRTIHAITHMRMYMNTELQYK